MLRSALRRPPRPTSSPFFPPSLFVPASPPPSRTRPAWLILSAERAFSSARSNGDFVQLSSISWQRRTSRPAQTHANGLFMRASPVRVHAWTLPLAPSYSYARAFHSTPRNEINPLPILAGLLKVSVFILPPTAPACTSRPGAYSHGLTLFRLHGPIDLYGTRICTHGCPSGLDICSSPTPQESQVQEDTRESGEIRSPRLGREEGANTKAHATAHHHLPHPHLHPSLPLLGNHYCQLGAHPANWKVSRYPFHIPRRRPGISYRSAQRFSWLLLPFTISLHAPNPSTLKRP